METAHTIHKFESAGLGQAPFRCTGTGSNFGPIQRGDITIGAPGQPMGTCDYCGTGIGNEFYIQSADGKKSVVGSECVKKSGDKGLKKAVTEAEAKKRRDKNKEQKANDAEFVRQNDGKFRFAVVEKYFDEKHPNIYLANAGKTKADYVLFTYEACGITSKAKMIRDFIKEV